MIPDYVNGTGSIIGPDEGEHLQSEVQDIRFKITGDQSNTSSSFLINVPDGFDVGAHYHKATEELFLVLEGNLLFMAFTPKTVEGHWSSWESSGGEKPIACPPGTIIHVPPLTIHAFLNSSGRSARMFFQASPPPDHEQYFRALHEIFKADGELDGSAIASIRPDYDVYPVSDLGYSPER